MFEKLNNLIDTNNNSKQDLLNILQELSKTISVFDQMKVTQELRSGMDDIQGPLKEEFFKVYAKYFVVRINDVRNDENSYDGNFNFDDFVKSIITLETQYKEPTEEKESSVEFKTIYLVISLYTTFILDEPIHPVGTKFPGNLEIIEENNTYYCPVKKNNENNPRAVCQFCIAEQLEYD